MLDVKQIDAFFENTSSLKSKSDSHGGLKKKKFYFLKLLMPSVAAVLISMIVLIPHLKKNTFVPQFDSIKPQLNELEKLHVEKTQFSMTDLDGKVNSFTADLMEELEPGSKIVRIDNPLGKIALKEEGKFVDVRAKTGYYNEPKNKISAKGDVVAVYDHDVTLETSQAEYDFNAGLAKGDKPVFAHGSFGKIWSDSFVYDKNKQILYLNGHTKALRDESVLTSQKQTIYDKNLSKIISIGNVVLERPDATIYADKVIIWLESFENIQVKKIEAFDNVVVYMDNARGKGRYGVYVPDSNLLELQGDVELTKNTHLVYGDRAVFDTKTSVGRVLSKSKHERVTGVIRGAMVKGKKHE